ncbi:hypothetical protein, partial [Salmonella enterica]|uniref:hypothetical protein n=1 Tax=Salmonella enterica TaxID=28901 RepID=UPI0039E96FD8
EAEKTQFIHFQGRPVKVDKPPLMFKDAPIKPQATIKLLGVLLDERLTYREHIAKCANKAYNAAAALKRMKGLLPQTARQLFIA